MAVKQYKDIKSVPKKYKWDLSFLLEGKTIQELLDWGLETIKKDIKTKDSKYASKAAYLKHLKRADVEGVQWGKISNYLSNNMSINVVNPEIQAIQQEFSFKAYELQQQLGPETPRFFAHAKEIAKWIKDKEFEPYRRDIQSSLESKKHQLPKAVQDYRNIASRGDMNTNSIFSILTNSELDYGYGVRSNGKKVKLNPAIISKVMKSPDKALRKSSSIAFRNAKYRHRESLSNMLFQDFKSTTVFAKTHKYKNTMEVLLKGDRVDEELLQTLYSSVQANKGIFKKYGTYDKKFFKAKYGEKRTKYDGALELVKPKGEYSPEDAMKLVLDSVKPFGKEYSDVVKGAFKDNWVDFMPIKNKRSGAYSIGGTYGIDKKLILMNFNGEFGGVNTLAHEMGHSMHSYFSDKYNHPAQSQYPIFVAEIASIFNEMMLADHVMKTTTDKKLKFKLLEQMINGFYGTVVLQTEWSNYEYDMYKGIEAGQPLSTYDAISKLYFENAKKYTNKKNPKYKPKNMISAVTVPHFYKNFYVYKYAIGQLAANAFFQKYKEEGPKALQTYIDKFLKAGTAKWPVQMLKDAGIDLHDPELYKQGFKAAKANIDEWVKLGKEIFKV